MSLLKKADFTQIFITPSLQFDKYEKPRKTDRKVGFSFCKNQAGYVKFLTI